MSKEALAISLIVFWLALPIPLQLMGITGYNILSVSEFSTEVPTGLESMLTSVVNFIGVYFQLLFFVIPSTNPYIFRFVNMLQVLTALFIVIMLRGN